MKYYSELSNIETQIIRLGAMSSVLRVISNGAEHSSDEDVRNALWYIEGSIEDIHDSLYARFNELWEVVRDEDFDELAEKVKNKHKGGMKKKKQMTDKELP
jgi:predicted transcriptional regulator